MFYFEPIEGSDFQLENTDGPQCLGPQWVA